MKKIIALALALVLALSMGSVAFAADAIAGATYAPGSEIVVFEMTGFENNTLKDTNKLSTEWTKGAALVDSVKITKDNKVVLTLKENYTITDAKDLDGKITLTPKDKANPATDFVIDLTVKNNTVTVFGEKKKDDADVKEAVDNTLYVCDEDTPGYVKFNVGALMGITLNMAAKEKAFMYQIENDDDIMDALEEKFPEAEIEAYTFGGQPTFKNAAEITLQADYSDQYFIYAYEGGKLTAVEADWNSIEGVYEWSTKSPRTYVISDVELVAAAEEAETKNPDTGANDVVGVAAALAVVSLVAAGAVSLKK